MELSSRCRISRGPVIYSLQGLCDPPMHAEVSLPASGHSAKTWMVIYVRCLSRQGEACFVRIAALPTAQVSTARVDSPPTMEKRQVVKSRPTRVACCTQHADGADDAASLDRFIVIAGVAYTIVQARRCPTGRRRVLGTWRASCAQRIE